MAIARVQFSQGGLNASSTTIATAAMATTTGNAIAVVVRGYQGGAGQDITSITDTAGNTYTIRAKYLGSDPYLWVASSVGITGHASNVVTATWDAAVSFRWIVALEYSGVDAYDTAGTNAQPAATDLVSTAINTATSGDVIVMGASQGGFVTMSAGADFTLVDGTLGGTSDQGGVEEYITNTQLLSYIAHITSSNSIAYTTAWIALRPELPAPTTPSIAWINA